MRRLFCWKTWWSVNPHYQINSSRSHCSLLSLLLLLFVSAQHLITPSTAKGVRGNIGISRTTSRMFATLGKNKRAKTENPIDPSKTLGSIYYFYFVCIYLCHNLISIDANTFSSVVATRLGRITSRCVSVRVASILSFFFDLGKS